MATQLIYLEDFDVVTCDAKITAIDSTEDGREDIQLDKTCSTHVVVAKIGTQDNRNG